MGKPLYAYANCWEDPAFAIGQLDKTSYQRILSIASGGDNALALLPLATDKVVAVDMHAEQLHLTALKVAVLQTLTREEALGFLGLHRDANRTLTYTRVREALTQATRDFWELHPEAIAEGVLKFGKLDQYFDKFRRYVLPLVHSRSTAERLLEVKSAQEQADFFAKVWNTKRWRAVFRVFFSQRVMSLLGRERAKFSYVVEPPAQRLMAQAASHLSSPAAQGNGFLHYLLVGGFGPYLPMYLRPGNYEALRAHLYKLELVHGDLSELASSEKFDLFNLSNIFEYMDEATVAKTAKAISEMSNDGAEVYYWNMMVERSLVEALPNSEFEVADDLGDGRADWGFFYRRFHRDRIVKSTAQ